MRGVTEAPGGSDRSRRTGATDVLVPPHPVNALVQTAPVDDLVHSDPEVRERAVAQGRILSSVPNALVAAALEVRRFARGILGSDAYDVYLAHHRRTGCGGAPLTEKQFWRAKYAAQDASPEGRCC